MSWERKWTQLIEASVEVRVDTDEGEVELNEAKVPDEKCPCCNGTGKMSKEDAAKAESTKDECCDKE